MTKHILRVLIVDDEKSIREPLAERLRRLYHYHVDLAQDGNEALSMIDQVRGRYDVALLDQVLDGELSGLDVLKTIKSKYPDIQVIVITGWEDEMKKEGFSVLQEGAYRYIAKPLNMEELALTIRFASEESQTRQERHHLAALVKVSQDLTQTKQQAEQLRLAWDFVREQLDVSTFLIGLFLPNDKRIHFPLVYDDGQKSDLSDTILGRKRSEWGLAGYVVKTGEEILWSTLEELEKVHKVRKITPIVVGKHPASGFLIPLQIRGQVRGVISTQSYQPHVFTPVLQNVLRALSNQLSVALENSELFTEVEQKAIDVERQANSVMALQSLALTINSSLDFNTIFTKTCQAAVEFFHADHSGLVLFDPQHTQGSVAAEYPDMKVTGKKIPLRGIPGEERLIKTGKPLVVHDVSSEESLGAVREILLGLNVQSILFVPVIGKEGIIGSFSLDAIHERRHFTEEDQALCKTFADYVAVAIENARLFTQRNETTEQLDALIENSFDAVIFIGQDRKIKIFNRQAEEMFGWQSEEMLGHTVARLHVDMDKAKEIFGEVNREGKITGRNLELKHRDGTRIPTLISGTVIRDSQGKPIGQVGYIHDLREAKSREQLLTALDEASQHIRAEKQPAKLLREIVRLAAELMGCAAGGLFINYPHIEALELTAVYGLPEDLIGTRSHYDGPIGHVAHSGAFQIISGYADRPDREAIFSHLNFQTVFGLPLKYAGDVEAILFVADTTGQRELGMNDQEILGRFAAQASTALHTSQLMDKEQRRFSQLVILHRISEYIQKARDLDKILHVVLTGVTAGYGLGFNRAGFLLLDEGGKILEGTMGIGHLVEAAAREDWAVHHQRGLEDFGKYLEASEQGAWPDTPMNKNIRLLRLPVEPEKSDPFSRAVFQQCWMLVTQEELSYLPRDFLEALAPALPFIIVPLLAREQVIGLLVADNKFTHAPITEEDIDSLMTFANTTAVAIDNARLITKEQEAALRMRRQADRLKVLLEIGTELTSAHDMDLIWDSIAKHLIRLVEARRSLFLVVDLKGKRLIKATGQGYPPEHLQRITFSEVETGVSGWVLRTKEAVLIENVQSDPRNTGQALERAMEFETAPIIVAPLLIKDEAIGTLTVANSVGDPSFDEDDMELVVMLASQAAIAYDNARRMHELEHLQKAAEALAGVLEPVQVLQQIVESACDILQADSSAVWSFDNVRNRTIPEELVAHGIPKDQLERFRKQAPTQGGTAETVMKKKWVGVTDISDPQYDFIGPSTMELLNRIGARSFCGIALRAGEENLGVIYVNYNGPREFTPEDRQVLETFANQAALALKKARLSRQVKRARDAAAVIAQIVALGKNSKEDWAANVDRIKEALPCDAVTLYRYNEDSEELEYPPSMAGVNYPDQVTRLPHVEEKSIIWKVLRSSDLLIVDDATSNPQTRDRRFTKEEDIKSFVGIPLKARDRKVGVMFINYRDKHRFAQDELIHINLFANQIAVAVRNAQFHERTRRQAETLDGLSRAGKAVTGLQALNRSLYCIAEQAWHLVGRRSSYTIIRLVENEIAKVVAAYPPEELAQRRPTFPEINLETGFNGRIGVTGRAIKTGTPQLVNNVSSSRDYIPSHPQVQSELAVPITLGKQVIGVINVDSLELGAFSENDQQTLISLADYAAIAIHNAQLHDEIRKRAETLESLYVASKAITNTLAAGEALIRIAEQALHVVGANPSEGCFGHVALCEGTKLKFIATCPMNMLDSLNQIEIDLETSPRIGIAGRTVLTGLSQNVPDVGVVHDYIPSKENINSQMSVPLRIGERIIGVLSIEHPKPAAFRDEDVKNVESLAAQAGVVIENARQYEELKQTKGLVGARTALAWMGMINSTWRHAIEKHAITIRDEIELCRRDLAQKPTADALTARLDKIERLASLIREKPITPPLGSEEGVRSVEVNEIIQERVKRLWEDEYYKPVLCLLNLHLDDSATVRASPEWLQRVLDILIENAVEATAGQLERKITIATQQVDSRVQICITDNGKGISPEQMSSLFHQPINKAQGEKGLGIGLLFAQLITQTYGGDIYVGSPGPGDTTMIITLALEPAP